MIFFDNHHPISANIQHPANSLRECGAFPLDADVHIFRKRVPTSIV
jgi:hypothetical protein